MNDTCKITETQLLSSTSKFLVFECDDPSIYALTLIFYAIIQLIRHWLWVQSGQVYRETLSIKKELGGCEYWDKWSVRCCECCCSCCINKSYCCCQKDEFEGLCAQSKRPLCKLVLLQCAQTLLWIISILFILGQNVGILLTALFSDMVGIYIMFKVQRTDHKHIVDQFKQMKEHNPVQYSEFAKMIRKIIETEETAKTLNLSLDSEGVVFF